MVAKLCAKSKVWSSRELHGLDPEIRLSYLGASANNENIQPVTVAKRFGSSTFTNEL